MTKKEAREALAEVYIRQLLEYGERVLPDGPVHLEQVHESLRALGIFKVYPGLGTMIMEHVETAREWPIEA
jgi:hypothetical protein